MRVAGAAFAALFLLVATSASAQSATDPPPLPVSVSNVPMVWHADVLSSAAVFSLTGADQAVRWLLPAAGGETGTAPKLIRSLELVGLDIPVATFFVVLNHELGHEFRASELHIPATLHLVASPWSTRPFDLVPDLALYPRVHSDSLFDLSMESSGLEASWLLKDRMDERILRHGSVRFGDAVTRLVASTDTPVYAASALGPGDLRDVGRGPQGDMANYVYELIEQRARAGQFDSGDVRANVRAKCFLNLIDFGLWSDVAGIWAWLARGDESRAQAWLGTRGFGLIPSIRYSLTPVGPEFSVRSHVRVGGTRASAYVRWSERIGNARQKGAGVTYLAPASHGLEPTIRFDAWSHTLNGGGGRGEVSVATTGWPSRRIGVSVAVGAKSSGYLEGYPLARSMYGVVGLNVAVR